VDDITEWVRVDPEIRAPLLASEISILATTDDGATVLSPLAAHLLGMVSNKQSVLNAFGGNFHPSHWSGSLAQTLTPFVTLAEGLLNHPEPLVANWAAESLKAMRTRIENDHRWEAGREESFE